MWLFWIFLSFFLHKFTLCYSFFWYISHIATGRARRVDYIWRISTFTERAGEIVSVWGGWESLVDLFKVCRIHHSAFCLLKCWGSHEGADICKNLSTAFQNRALMCASIVLSAIAYSSADKLKKIIRILVIFQSNTAAAVERASHTSHDCRSLARWCDGKKYSVLFNWQLSSTSRRVRVELKCILHAHSLALSVRTPHAREETAY